MYVVVVEKDIIQEKLKEVRLSLKARQVKLTADERYELTCIKKESLKRIIGNDLSIKNVNAYLKKCNFNDARRIIVICDCIGLKLNMESLDIIVSNFDKKIDDIMYDIELNGYTDSGYIASTIIGTVLSVECTLLTLFRHISNLSDHVPKVLSALRSTFGSFCKTINSASSFIKAATKELSQFANAFDGDASTYANVMIGLVK